MFAVVLPEAKPSFLKGPPSIFVRLPTDGSPLRNSCERCGHELREEMGRRSLQVGLSPCHGRGDGSILNAVPTRPAQPCPVAAPCPPDSSSCWVIDVDLGRPGHGPREPRIGTTSAPTPGKGCNGRLCLPGEGYRQVTSTFERCCQASASNTFKAVGPQGEVHCWGHNRSACCGPALLTSWRSAILGSLQQAPKRVMNGVMTLDRRLQCANSARGKWRFSQC